MNKRNIFVLILAAAVFLALVVSVGEVEEVSRPKTPRTTVAADGLEIPWGLVFLPDGSLLFTERPGRVRLVDREGRLLPSPAATLAQVKQIGEGGLLGIATHPDFSNNHLVYLYYTYSGTAGNTLNRVSRFKFENSQLTAEEVIVEAIPGAANHNGGRIKFGPDGFLYITTGDAQEPSRAQDKNSLSGKILRVTDEGKPVPGNPFNNLVYSYGHRNPQGLAWDSQNRLWSTEHGRSGILSGLDEVNLVEAGKNYGWPTIQGNEQKEGMERPKLHSNSNTWAPAGAAFAGESFFFGGLRGEALYEAVVKGDQITLKEHFKGEFGRIREVVLGPDGFLYLTTSNRDGRGTVQTGDDKIIKISLQNLGDL